MQKNRHKYPLTGVRFTKEEMARIGRLQQRHHLTLSDTIRAALLAWEKQGEEETAEKRAG